MKIIILAAVLFLSSIYGQDKKENQKDINKDDYILKADEMPFPVGGLEAILKNIVYPEEAAADSIEGRVFVLAFIDESGIVVKTDVIKSDNQIFNNAARNAVNKVKFTPGKVKGKNVKVQVTVPIVFKLK